MVSSLPHLSCGLSLSVKENPDRKKQIFLRNIFEIVRGGFFRSISEILHCDVDISFNNESNVLLDAGLICLTARICWLTLRCMYLMEVKKEVVHKIYSK